MFRIALQESADLRPLEPSDSPRFLALIERERAHFGTWLPWGADIDTEEKARGFIQRLADRQATDQGRGYAIWLDGEMVGGALFRTFDIKSGNCEIRVWLAAHATGRGLMTTACNILIDWAFEDRGMHRVEWHVASGNEPSIRTAKRLGMQLDGVMRASFPYRNERHDFQVWSLLRTDPRPVQQSAASATRRVREPLEQYICGHQTRQADAMRAAFLPTARIEGMRPEGFTSWDVETYCGFFDGVPAADEVDRTRVIDSVRVQGTVAMAQMTLIHGTTKFTDMFVLLEQPDGEWKIANKAYHAESL